MAEYIDKIEIITLFTDINFDTISQVILQKYSEI